MKKKMQFDQNFITFGQKNFTKSKIPIFRKQAKTLLFQAFHLVKNRSAEKTLLNQGTFLFEGYENRELTVLAKPAIFVKFRYHKFSF